MGDSQSSFGGEVTLSLVMVIPFASASDTYGILRGRALFMLFACARVVYASQVEYIQCI